MFLEELQQIGLNKDQAIVYEAILESQGLSVAEIAQKTPFKKGNLYNIVDELLEHNLVSKKERGKKSIIIANHPNRFLDIVKQKEKEVRTTSLAMNAIMPELVSTFNLQNNKPGVVFYEGVEGFKKVEQDLFTTKSEIITFLDEDGLIHQKDVPTAFDKYQKKYSIKKRIIAPKTKKTQDYIKDWTWKKEKDYLVDIRLVDQKIDYANTVMQCYDNKVAIMVHSDKKQISMIITDPNIVTMIKSLFEFHWNHAEQVHD